MTCRRCGGLMVVESIYDAAISGDSDDPQEVLCLNCGNVEDAVIYANRMEPRMTRTTAHYKIGIVIVGEPSWGKERQLR